MRLNHLSPMRALPSLSLVVFSMAVSLDADGRIEFEDSVARSRYEYLVKRSATMREMVSVIDTTPDVLVRIRARPGLQDSFPHPAHGHELAVSCSDVEPPAVPAATPGSR
jgi:hypothetical protein